MAHRIVTATLLLGLAGSCGRCEGEPEPLRVWAAASLADLLPRVAEAWRAEGGPEVAFSFDASSRLARQIEAGAPADVFVAADDLWMDYLDERALIVPSTRTALLHNRLAVVVRAGVPPPAAPAELAEDRFARVALATEEVPAGRYAEQALRHHHLHDRLSSRFVRGGTVRTALAWVASGEADAAIVYATDARAEPRARLAFLFEAESHRPIVYPAAVTRRAQQADLAERFLELLRGERARALFEDAGFEVP